MSTEAEYTLTISLETLRHLGIGLYSNIPAVLSETVANAYDADATEVTIDIDSTNRVIVITDNGWGMSKDDINNKYLRVGYEKRKQETRLTEGRTPKGRSPMGRKGIGKLALFSIADTVEVHSAKQLENGDIEKAGFVMTVKDIQDCIKTNAEYHPVPVNDVLILQGTRIELRDLRLSPDTTAPFLRRKLSRRFSIIGSDTGFDVKIDNEAIGVDDREYFRNVEFLWYFGDYSDRYKNWASNSTHQVSKDGIVDVEQN